jgi:protein ImuA
VTSPFPAARPAPQRQPPKLAALRVRLAGLAVADPQGALAFGDARVAAHLPPGGLPLGALHEIAAAGLAAETGALQAAFIACLLALLLRRPEARPALWIARRADLYPPGLLAYGLDPARLVLVQSPRDATTLAGAEAALREGAAAAVVAETGALAPLAARRLHLAARTGGSTGFVLRRWPHGRKATDREANAAATRWRLAPAPSVPDPSVPDPSGTSPGEPGPPRWQVTLAQARGGRPGAWIMELTEGGQDAPPALRVVAGLADAAGPAEQRRRA